MDSHKDQDQYKFLVTVLNWIFYIQHVASTGTFASFNRMSAFEDLSRRVMQYAICNVPLVHVVGFSCLVGGLAISWAWWTLRHHYAWLAGRILL